MINVEKCERKENEGDRQQALPQNDEILRYMYVKRARLIDAADSSSSLLDVFFLRPYLSHSGRLANRNKIILLFN